MLKNGVTSFAPGLSRFCRFRLDCEIAKPISLSKMLADKAIGRRAMLFALNKIHRFSR